MVRRLMCLLRGHAWTRATIVRLLPTYGRPTRYIEPRAVCARCGEPCAATGREKGAVIE
jgi:hypothetical protein